MATTPPSTAVIDTPSTPRHAGEASRHYNTRKSTRHIVTRKSRVAETPPPDTELHHKIPASRTRRVPSPHSSAQPPQSPPSSTHTSPRTKIIKGKRSTGPRHYKMEDQGGFRGDEIQGQEYSSNPGHGLPTPASIPRKKPVPKGAVDSAARVLFPSRTENADDAMPTPRKRKSRRQVGFSLYSSMEDDGASSEEKIQIYTDSKDKVPELTEGKDNPFIERPRSDSPQPEPVKVRTSRKRKHGRVVETNPQIEEAFNRDEGMVYVFRGKKMYRKFPQDSDSECEDEPAEDPETSNLRPLTRSSIKPRLLFPTAKQQAERSAATIAAEEAPTDIEDHAMTHPEGIVTPVKKSFAPATPPTTGHATRSSTKKARDATLSPLDMESDGVAMPTEKKKKVSPFDSWARTKAGASGTGKGRKREGEAMERNEGAGGKRVRSFTEHEQR